MKLRLPIVVVLLLVGLSRADEQLTVEQEAEILSASAAAELAPSLAASLSALSAMPGTSPADDMIYVRPRIDLILTDVTKQWGRHTEQHTWLQMATQRVNDCQLPDTLPAVIAARKELSVMALLVDHAEWALLIAQWEYERASSFWLSADLFFSGLAYMTGVPNNAVGYDCLNEAVNHAVEGVTAVSRATSKLNAATIAAQRANAIIEYLESL